MKPLLCALALVFAGVLHAQELSIEWGSEFDSSTEIQKILGFADGKMVAYTIKGKKRYLETYTEGDMSLSNTAEYELPEIDGKESGLLNATLSGKKISMMLYVYNKKERSFKLYSQLLDLNGKPEGKPTELYDSGATDEKMKDPKVDVVFSTDNTKALVYFDRKDSDRLEFYSDNLVIDLTDNLTVISSEKHEFSIRKEKSENIAFKAYHSIENDGSYGIVREMMETKLLKILDFGLKVGRYDKTGQIIGESDVNQEGMIFLSPTLLVQDGKTKMVGYYMNNEQGKNYVSGYSGLFVADFDNNMTLEGIKTNQFSNEFLKNVYGEGRVDRMEEKGKELRVPAPYTMNDIFMHEDGSMTVLSEFYQVVVTQDKGQQTTTTTYGSILFFKIDSEGTLTSSDAIHKMQVSSTTSIGIGLGGGSLSMFASIELPDKMQKYWSYASSVSDDGDIYIVFNDHFKNQGDDEDDLSRALRNPKKSVPYLTTIDAEGGFSKKAMVDSGDEETYLVPMITYPLNNSDFVIWGIWKKLNKFGLATIK